MYNKIELEQQLSQVGRQILAASRDELYMRMRFLDVALSSFDYTLDPSGETLGTDGFHMYYNPRHLGGLYRSNRIQVNRAYLHMVLHCILRHLNKKAFPDEFLWHISCDIVVESIIDSLYIRSVLMPGSAFRREAYRLFEKHLKVLTPEGIYRTFEKLSLSKKEQMKFYFEFLVDDHGYWLQEDNQQKQNQLNQKWQDISDQMEMNMETFSKEVSTSSESLLEQLKVENRDRYDYASFLRKFSVLKEEIKVDIDSFDYSFYSYGLQLYGNMPLIEPQEWKEVQKIEEFVIVIDTSMSCSGTLVRKFLEETYHILSETESFFRKVNIHIIQCDEKVQSDQKITNEEDLKNYMNHLELRGKGGTDFRPAFDYVNQMVLNRQFTHLKGLIYFTDGYGTYPTRMPHYETAFVFLKEDYQDVDVPPWAIKLILNEEEFEGEIE